MLFSTDSQNLKMGRIQGVTFGESLKQVITLCGQILVSRTDDDSIPSAWHTRGRFERTHGDELSGHTGFFQRIHHTRKHTHTHTPRPQPQPQRHTPQTPHVHRHTQHHTQHNTQHHTETERQRETEQEDRDRERERPSKKTETEREREREEKTKEKKTREKREDEREAEYMPAK